MRSVLRREWCAGDKGSGAPGDALATHGEAAQRRPLQARLKPVGTAMVPKTGSPDPMQDTSGGAASGGASAAVEKNFFPGLGRSALGMWRIEEGRRGAAGMIAAIDSIFSTRSDGWAPTDSQYLMRSEFNRICLQARRWHNVQ